MEEICGVVKCTPTLQPMLPDPRASDMKLKLKKNISYVVAGVAIQDDQILMIQEAKISCYKKWYLPAGRMERNESIVEAVRREVSEESGMEFEPEALITVEMHGYEWVRFTFTGRITGGSLKTKDKADKESIQGAWFSEDSGIKLRSSDIIPLMRTATNWYKSRPYTCIPVPVGHVSISLRLLLINDDGNCLRALVATDEGGSTRLPVCLPSHQAIGVPLIDNTIKACSYGGQYKQCGVLSVEHLGKPSGTFDGFCLTVLFTTSSLDLIPGSKVKGQINVRAYEWMVVSDQGCVERLRQATQEGGCASLIIN